MSKFSTYLKSKSFSELLRYTVTGVLTTVVSYSTFYLFNYKLHIESNTANTLSVICAVIFAYFANKCFVFKTKCPTLTSLIKEAVSFFSARGIAMVIEVSGYFILYSLLCIDALISKILVNIIVLMTNYLLSKFIVFRKQKIKDGQ